MPDPQPKKPRWSQPPPETPAPPPKKPLPTAKPITPPAATPPPPTKPAPQQPLPTPPPANRPTAVPRPTQPLPTPPPATRPPPRPQPLPVPAAPLPAYSPPTEPVTPSEAVVSTPPKADLVANLLAKLHEILSIPGVPFAVSLVVFTVVPMAVVLLFFPSRPVVHRDRETQPTTIEPVKPQPPEKESPPKATTAVAPPPKTPAPVPTNPSPSPPPKVSPPSPSPAAIVVYTEDDARRIGEAVRHQLRFAVDQLPLIEFTREIERQTRYVVQIDDAALTELNLTPAAAVPVTRGVLPLKQRLTALRDSTGVDWSAEMNGVDLRVRLTSPVRSPRISVSYASEYLAPGGRLAQASLVISKAAARTAWQRVAGRSAVEVDEARKLVTVIAPWSVHAELDPFFDLARDSKSQNACEVAVLKTLRLGYGADQQRGVTALMFDTSGGQRFANDQLELLAVFPNVTSVSVRSADMDGAGISRLPNAGNFENLDFSGSGLTDATLKEIAGLPKLRNLNLSRTKFTDAGLAALTDAAQLTDLNLSQSPFSDAGAESIARCRSVNQLNLNETRVTDRGVEIFAKSLNLGRIDLADTAVGNATLQVFAAKAQPPGMIDIRRTRVDGAGLAQLAKIRNVHHLSVGDRSLQPADYAPLAQLTSMRSLKLVQCTINNEFAAAIGKLHLHSLEIDDSVLAVPAALANLTELDSLQLRSTQVTNDSLDELAKLPKLRMILIFGPAAVTPAKIAELKKERPQLNIHHIPQPPPAR